jgi:hypothetical protein
VWLRNLWQVIADAHFAASSVSDGTVQSFDDPACLFETCAGGAA